ncbi:MAG TPA: flagellar motor switch protein FliG [Pseudomonadales bacterium]|nr:flagellar motor switch protein FliG [Pseudomonadales bacterium]
MEGVDRAAVLLLALGEDDAARVLKHLDPREVHRVGTAMAALRSVNMGQISMVLNAFLETVTGQSGLAIGASEYIRKMLIGALGEEKSRTLVDRILGGTTAGLDKLKWLDARTIAEFMMHEHPQIQAIVLSSLEPEQAAEVLGFMTDPEAKVDVLTRIATLDSVPPNALSELNAVLEEQVSGKSLARFAQMGGARVAAEIMNKLGGKADEEILAGIRASNEELGNEIQDLMFIFDNLMDVDDKGIQVLLREVSTDNLVLALKGAEESLKEKIFTNMSKRAADLLKDDLENKGPVRVSEVEAAQREILVIARRLADAGEIVLGGSGEELI